jgi:hypothetical protein
VRYAPDPHATGPQSLGVGVVRPGHAWATSHELSRLAAVTHGHSTQQASRNVVPGRPIFQAGHEGSIPFARTFARTFARSTTKAQVKVAPAGP